MALLLRSASPNTHQSPIGYPYVRAAYVEFGGGVPWISPRRPRPLGASSHRGRTAEAYSSTAKRNSFPLWKHLHGASARARDAEVEISDDDKKATPSVPVSGGVLNGIVNLSIVTLHQPKRFIDADTEEYDNDARDRGHFSSSLEPSLVRRRRRRHHRCGCRRPRRGFRAFTLPLVPSSRPIKWRPGRTSSRSGSQSSLSWSS